MIASLARKELRALAPFVVLIMLIWGGDLLVVPLSDFADQKPLDTWIEEIQGDSFHGIVLFLVAFSLAMGLLVGERDRGTLELLDSLPVSRTQVFAVKVAVGLLVLAAGPVTAAASAALFHAVSRSSLDDTFHAGVLGASVLLHSFHAAVFFCWGLLLSFLRRFAWIAAALIYLGLSLLVEVDPGLSIFDPMSLSTMSFEGQRWLVPWRLLALQAALAALALAAAWRLFVGSGDGILRGLGALGTSRAGRYVLVAATVAAVGLWTAVAVIRMPHEPASHTAEPRALSRLATEAYVFTFPSAAQHAATDLARRADGIDERVRSFFGSPRLGGIVVDASGIRASAAADGLATWKTIRLDLGTGGDGDDLAAVLGHETAHVYASALSDRRLDLPFVDEGLAEYVENRLFRDEGRRGWNERRAAILRARRQVDFEELMDPERLRRRLDPDVVYPLGEAFVAALVSSYGDGAPAAVLHALGRKDAPRLSGLELWQDAFGEAGFDLDRVVDEFYATLDEAVARHRAAIDALPRVRGRLETKDARVGITIDPPPDALAPRRSLCRFRRDADEAREDFFGEGVVDGSCWAPRAAFPSGVVQYQLGLFDPGIGIVWEAWSEAPLRP